MPVIRAVSPRQPAAGMQHDTLSVPGEYMLVPIAGCRRLRANKDWNVERGTLNVETQTHTEPKKPERINEQRFDFQGTDEALKRKEKPNGGVRKIRQDGDPQNRR